MKPLDPMRSDDDQAYLDGYRAGLKFVEQHEGHEMMVMKYALFHVKRYRQTKNDAGFIDAILLAFGA
jgi:hypothetical protein